MIRYLARAAALAVAGPYLLLASALAPQHVHEAPGHDHEHALAHSHFAPHTVEAAHTQTEIEHDEARVVWLEVSVLHQSSNQASPVPLVAERRVALGFEPFWSSIPADVSAPAHGPPRLAHPFRGPPTLV